MKTRWFAIAACAAVAAALGTIPALAGATTICVPGFSAQCPNANGNVVKADLEEAMAFQSTDGVADTIFVDAGTYEEVASGTPFEPDGSSSKTSFEPKGSDPLTIVGAGIAQTMLTSTSSSNEYIVNLSHNNSRAITIRDLTIGVPATQPDGLGAAVVLYNGDVLDNVNVMVFNKDGDGVFSSGTGNVFRNGQVQPVLLGTVEDGVGAKNPNSSLLVEDSIINQASWALVATGGGSVTARRVEVVDARTYGAIASSGSLTVENSTMTIDDGVGLYLSATATDVSLSADHVTIVNSGTGDPAIEGKKFGADAGNATMTVTNSILRGFDSGYKAETQIGPGIGLVQLTARYSNLSQNGTLNGGDADFATGNIDADPLLAADFSLPPGSPSVDAGDPGAGLATDFLGAPRPNDGNGDGIARRDQGAFEYQAPPRVAPGPVPGADTTAPATTIKSGPGKGLAAGRAKFVFKSSEAGSSFQCKLDAKRVTRCKSPRAYRGLQPGRHIFRVWAIDAAGNKDATPAKRRFRVPD